MSGGRRHLLKSMLCPRGVESLHSFYYRQHQPEDWLRPRGLQNQESNRDKNWSQGSDQMGPEAHTVCKPLSDGSQQTLFTLGGSLSWGGLSLAIQNILTESETMMMSL